MNITNENALNINENIIKKDMLLNNNEVNIPVVNELIKKEKEQTNENSFSDNN
ncbi:hypothetical protein LCGC14_3076270, partial [marine sediment metagenome]